MSGDPVNGGQVSGGQVSGAPASTRGGDRAPIETVSSRVAYANPWITVREDLTHRTDTGADGLYGVLVKPDFAVVIPEQDGGFHLVRQYRYPVRRRSWEFPQGTWPDASAHTGDGPLDLAAAELAEETGLRAGSMAVLGFLYEAYGVSTQGMHVVHATDLTPGERALEETEADLETAWFTEADFWWLVDSGELVDGPSLAAWALLSRSRTRGTGGT